MRDLEIPEIARWFMADERMPRQDCLTIAARIIVAAELRPLAGSGKGTGPFREFEQELLLARVNEFDPEGMD